MYVGVAAATIITVYKTNGNHYHPQGVPCYE